MSREENVLQPLSLPPRFGEILFASPRQEMLFSRPVEIITAWRLADVLPSLRRIASACDQGCFAAGFLCYEAAPAFSPTLATRPPQGDFPLLWFGIYRAPQLFAPPSVPPPDDFEMPPWTALLSPGDYRDKLARIAALIAAGDTYQVNFTFPLEADFSGNSFALFRRLCTAQHADYCAYLHAGRTRVLCASPELFFRRDNQTLTARPMKGTARRALWPEEDRSAGAHLGASTKDRAENLMIVDLLRNDLGRISSFGSLRVPQLFEVEKYPTLWQMTSTITSHSRAPLPEILRALFPCGSVTGAPKIRTMQILRDLESSPRGIYCGSIGWCAPGGLCEFNVAIRTVTLDTIARRARYFVGSAITADSSPEGEYEECLAKAAVLTHFLPDFRLLESLRFDGDYWLLAEHLERLGDSADYFGFTFDRQHVAHALDQYRGALLAQDKAPNAAPLKVRLELQRSGKLTLQHQPAGITPHPIRLAIAASPVDETDVLLYHKTTRRAPYESALASRPQCDDVLLFNRRGELTESTRANLVVCLEGKLLTPPQSCGLLNGTLRRHLLAKGRIQEAVLHKEELQRAASIHLINSVRGWMQAVIVL